MEIYSPITGKRGVALPFSDDVKPLVDSELFANMLDFIMAYGRRNGWRTLNFHGGKEFFKTNESYASFISPTIDLNLPSKTLFRRFRNSTQRNTKKAIKLGVKTTIRKSQESMNAFCRLNRLTRRRHGLPPQPVRFFNNIQKHIMNNNKGFICLAHHAGKAIAGAVFLTAHNQAIYKYGASDHDFFHLRPNNLVMATAIRYITELGLQTINLGRTEKEHKGQLQFKLGWSASPSEISYFKIDLASGKCIVDPPLIRSSYSLFKRLPISILEIFGALAYRHIG